MKKIYSELARIQQELKAPKNLYNSFGKYKYRNAEGILNAVKPLLNGLSLIINDDLQYIGNRYYIKATATLTDGDDSVSAVAFAREDEAKKGMDGCQITGACSSYARKYALNALLMIDDSKDSDDDSLSPKNPENSIDLPAPESEKKPFNRPAAKSTAPSATTVNKVPEAENSIGNAFSAGMDEFMQRYGMDDSAGALQLFNEFRTALQQGGVLPNNKKMQSVEEVNDTFDAIYANFAPSGEKK